jgi:pimeloyl-ACP methyl ester carboxylesterase
MLQLYMDRFRVIAGARGNLPPELVREIADGIPAAELVVFDSSGHFAPLERPKAFAAAVFHFLGDE